MGVVWCGLLTVAFLNSSIFFLGIDRGFYGYWFSHTYIVKCDHHYIKGHDLPPTISGAMISPLLYQGP